MSSVQAQRHLRQEMLPVHRQHTVYRLYHEGMLSVANLPPLYQSSAIRFHFLKQRKEQDLGMQVKKGCGKAVSGERE